MIKREIKGWGFEDIWAQTNAYIGKILHLHGGHAINFQYHTVKDKTIFIQNGRVQLEYFDLFDEKNKKIFNMVPGDTFRIRPNTYYRLAACQDVDIIEVSTPELHDMTIRLQDQHNKVNINGKNLRKNTNKCSRPNFITNIFSWLWSRFKRDLRK